MHLKCYHSNYHLNDTCQIRTVIFVGIAEETGFSLMAVNNGYLLGTLLPLLLK